MRFLNENVEVNPTYRPRPCRLGLGEQVWSQDSGRFLLVVGAEDHRRFYLIHQQLTGRDHFKIDEKSWIFKTIKIVKKIFLQKQFVMLEALCCCSSYNWCYCAPLTWHQFSKMKQFFFLLATPFSFLD